MWLLQLGLCGQSDQLLAALPPRPSRFTLSPSHEPYKLLHDRPPVPTPPLAIARVLVTLSNGPASPETMSVPKHAKYPPAGEKIQTRTNVSCAGIRVGNGFTLYMPLV